MPFLAGAALFLACLSCSAAAGGGKWGQWPAPPVPRAARGDPGGRLLAGDGCTPGNPPGALDSYGDGCKGYAGYEGYCGCCDDDDFSSALCKECTPGLVMCTRSLEEELASLPSNVKRISLNGQTLAGTLPSDLAQRFPNLTELSLNNNELVGEIPEGLWSLPRLQILDLAGNSLVGGLPEAVGQAHGLVSLDLSWNGLSGPLPAAVGSWTQLESVKLNNNKLTGGLPAAMANWSKVSVVDLSSNMLSGSLPQEVLGAWHSLQKLHLQKNRFSGSIPKTVGRLTKLEVVSLEGNELSGMIPEDVGLWQRIRQVDFMNNKLTGGLPAAMANWSEVTHLYLSNNALSGGLPEDVLGAWSKIIKLYMDRNHFSGPIPRAVGQWTRVVDVAMASNELSGPIPEEVGQWQRLDYVYLAFNKLTGPLPTSVGQWSSVTWVELGSNRLSGALPDGVANWTQVNSVILLQNGFTGSLPKAVGSWTRVTRVILNQCAFSGQLPAEIGEWRNVETVELYSNQFNGQLPREIGNWPKISTLTLFNNNFSGKLPQEMSGMVSLEGLYLSDNRFEGELPDLSGLLHIKELNLRNNSITGTGPLPPNLRALGLMHNQLTSLPEAVYELQELEMLFVNWNNITSWPPRGVVQNAGVCGVQPQERRFSLPKLQRLVASGNPMAGAQIQTFLNSLAYLPSLTELTCRRCQLGGVAAESHSLGLADDVQSTGDNITCAGRRIWEGFQQLKNLDLAQNKITGILVVPSRNLLRADFSENALEKMSVGWFNLIGQNALVSLNVAGNPALRMPVMQPLGQCKRAGSQIPVADPSGYAGQAEGHECTELCHGIQTKYTHDGLLDASALCRCRPGFGGQGVNCSACAADSYSSSDEGDEYRLDSECRQCPEGSTTGGQARSTSMAACLCPPGTFLNWSAAACAKCPQWPFRSTQAFGETKASACTCNASYAGLKEFGGTCGCDDGSYMNHRTLSCERCSNAERCTWATAIQRSLLPPVLKPGHWAEPVTKLARFAKHSIWRCASKESCGEGGVCAAGREGHACGLCKAGHHGGPDGPCEPCDEELSPASRRWSLALGTLVILVPAVVLMHIGLVAKDEGVQMGLHLEATVGSVKQMVKHFQTISIIGGMSVSWPPLAQAFFEALKGFTVNVPSLLQIGCLSNQTSVAMEMGFKWIMPLAFAAITAIAMAFSHLVSLAIRSLARHFPRALRRLPRPEKVAMGPADAARVLLFTLTIFWTTLASNCMEMLTCAPSPNGKFTVDTYPQVLCSFMNREFVVMGILSLLAAVLYLLVPLKVLWMSYIRTTKRLAMSERSERGWFSFLFQDFRDGHLLWLVEIMAKDASFVLVPVLLPGQGAWQLLLIAGLSAAHVCAVLQSTPFRDRSNSLLEAWNGATGAVLCIYSVGMGYQKEVGMDEIEELFPDGKEDPLYQGRASGMVAVQVIAVGVPVLFLLYQLLCALERSRGLLPQWLRPPSPQESTKWLQDFFEEDEALQHFAGVLKSFDRVDLHHFRMLMEHSSATLGHKHSKASRSYLVRLHSEISRSSSRQEGEELDPMDEEPEGAPRCSQTRASGQISV